MKFIHAADIHLDSPLNGLSAYPDAPAEQLRSATRDAFTVLVDRAIEEAVDFMVIAGDLYDGSWRDYNTGIFFCKEMGRLKRAGIPVYVLFGNHDAESEMTKKLELPDNVHTFGANKPQTLKVDGLAVVLHGQSFKQRDVTTNLVAGYPAPVTGHFNVGVLHTALEGYASHAIYAPCTIDELHAKGLGREMSKRELVLAPLLTSAGVASLAEAAPLVARSEARRKLVQEIDVARRALTQGSDGLGLDAVVAEVTACDLAQVAVDWTSTGDSIEQVQAEQTRLAAEHTQAKLAVEAFGGGRDAAVAEARRQEALAGMADASERYIKVTAAAKLLSWATERYREQNQGPMLARAEAIFSMLTLGRFTRLSVGFDSTPYRLTALRPDGRPVEVPGLSEGTRDQLYLALRLAALELHLAKAKALPFVADDLFINFDDERSTAGLEALRELSKHTQVLFLSHHDHLMPRVQQVFGSGVNVVQLQR